MNIERHFSIFVENKDLKPRAHWEQKFANCETGDLLRNHSWTMVPSFLVYYSISAVCPTDVVREAGKCGLTVFLSKEIFFWKEKTEQPQFEWYLLGGRGITHWLVFRLFVRFRAKSAEHGLAHFRSLRLSMETKPNFKFIGLGLSQLALYYFYYVHSQHHRLLIARFAVFRIQLG